MLSGPELGGKVRELRHEKGLTKVQFGDRMGVSPRTVYAWETRGPPLWARMALAAFMYGLQPWPLDEGRK